MKLGLLTDVHEEVKLLQGALDVFRCQRVDQVVLLGDVVSMAERLDETCRLLAAAGTIGVWGNHDLGLCTDFEEEILARYSPEVRTFMSTLRPRLDIGECHFTHVEPWLDPEDVLEINYYEGPPDQPEKLARIFGAVPNRVLFTGHYHRWLLATPQRIEAWSGQKPLTLNTGRYFVVIGAVCDGCFAIFDTDSNELIPYNHP